MEKQLERLGSRWAAVCRWTEDQWVILQEVLLRWQQFNDEQTKFSVWLAEKESVLTCMGQADLSDPDQVIVQVKHLKVRDVIVFRFPVLECIVCCFVIKSGSCRKQYT